MDSDETEIADEESGSNENGKIENIDFDKTKNADEEYPTRAKEIVRLEGDTYRFNHEALKQIIDENNISEHIIAIISVNGNTRTGKSFLLNFFVRYFRQKDKQVDYLDGFISKKGTAAVTSGIWIWPEPLLRRDKEDRDVAVLLMDTQGLFDNQTTMRGNKVLVWLSFMLSSVFIYNVKGLLTHEKLEYVDLFSSYAAGQNVSKSGNLGVAFPNLTFILRDWEHDDEFEFGMHYSTIRNDSNSAEFFPNQRNYLKKMLSDEQSEDYKKALNSIKGIFSKIEFCLLPHPGLDVPKLQGRIEIVKIGEIFSQFVQKFVRHQIENAVEDCGKRFTGAEFSKHVDNLRNAYYGGKSLSLKEIQTNYELNLLMTDKIATYDANFSESDLLNMPFKTIIDEHNTLNTKFTQECNELCKRYYCDLKSNEPIANFLQNINDRLMQNLDKRLVNNSDEICKIFNESVFSEAASFLSVYRLQSDDSIKKLTNNTLKTFEVEVESCYKQLVQKHFNLLKENLIKSGQAHHKIQKKYLEHIDKFYDQLIEDQLKAVTDTISSSADMTDEFKKKINSNFRTITANFKDEQNIPGNDISAKYLQKLDDYFNETLIDNIILMYKLQIESVEQYISATNDTIKTIKFNTFLSMNIQFLNERLTQFNSKIENFNNKKMEEVQKNILTKVLEDALERQCRLRREFNEGRVWIVKLVKTIFFLRDPENISKKAKEAYKMAKNLFLW